MAHNDNLEDDEIDLGELFATLWAYKFLIGFITSIGVVLSVFFALSQEPLYTVKSVFELDEEKQNNSLPGGLSELSLFSNLQQDNNTIFDRVIGREFIDSLSARLNLSDDVYFNPEPAAINRFSISYIRKLLPPNLIDESEESKGIEAKIAEIYLENVTIEETLNGATLVEVTHSDPEQAALIANTIVDQLATDIALEKEAEQKAQVNYLSEQLANALFELERTEQAAVSFALINSLGSEDELAIRSQLLFNLRENLRINEQTAGAIEAIIAISALDRAPSVADYQRLQKLYPVIDGPEFRRLIGISEDPSFWAWPDVGNLSSIQRLLETRIAGIKHEISELRVEAERYAAANEELIILQREAKTAEATYTVLIEQVKAQALAAGFQSKILTIFERARPPIRPTWPKKILIVLLGMIISIVIGSATALIRSNLSGRIYSRRTLYRLAQAPTMVRATGLRKLYMRDLHKTIQRMRGPNPSDVGLVDLSISQRTAKKSLALFLPSARNISALPAALWLSCKQKSNSPVTLLILDTDFKQNIKNQEDHFDILRQTAIDNINILFPAPGITPEDVFSSDIHIKLLKECQAQKGSLFVSVSSEYANATLLAFGDIPSYSILLTRVKWSQKSIIAKIQQAANIDATMEV